uniref:NADH-ubiquinone oxidoreductase chain 2 n=1 Tax=Ophiura albida TaxID=72672 RepID=B2FDN1_OPHAL|nr:NADH dehydrogenase subunit 2 [Ophiura albida]CAL50586.1 NADH dehydrogenase subunit 2 [Ophiura albida]
MNNLLFYIGALMLSILGCSISSNWLVLWLWIELNSLALIPILSSNITPRSIEATSKYFLFQATGSVILLLGILFRHMNSENLLIIGYYNTLELVIIIFALTLKMGIFPNHFWFIDVMQGINFLNGFFVSIISKIIPLYIIISINNSLTFFILYIIGVSSVLIGSIFGVQQTQLRKLIALSSITHLGWMIILFANTSNNWIGILLFLSYIIMVTPLFWLGNIFAIEHLSKGVSLAGNFTLMFTFIVSILSIAGFPPLLGFFYKWIIFYNIIGNSNFLVIGILIMASLLSLFYYINICINFYMNLWSPNKIIFNNFISEIINNNLITVTIVIANLLLFILIWNLAPISSTLNF